jgi:hypothetical protein
MNIVPVFINGEIPRPRSHASCILRGNLMYIIGGSMNEIENYEFSSCLIFDLGINSLFFLFI